MVTLKLCIVNSKNEEAVVGDTVIPYLYVQSILKFDKPHVISEIRADGTVVFDECLCQHISGINDFVVVK